MTNIYAGRVLRVMWYCTRKGTLNRYKREFNKTKLAEELLIVPPLQKNDSRLSRQKTVSRGRCREVVAAALEGASDAEVFRRNSADQGAAAEDVKAR